MAEPNSAQRSDWNGGSGLRWVADADRRDRVLQPVLAELITAARIEADERVLDIGCGCGATTFAAAARLRTGTVMGLDLSRTMLDVARERAVSAERVTFVEADAQTHRIEPAADVVISRFGMMFFDDPVAAFSNIRCSVKPHGRLCIATWQPLAANEWLAVPSAVLLRHTDTPPATERGPGMFSLSEPAAVAAMLSAAGWVQARVEPREVALPLGASAADAVDYLSTTGLGRAILETIDPDLRPAALAELETALAPYADDGIRLKAGINLIHATA